MSALGGSLPLLVAVQLTQATLFGTVRDSETGQALEGAVVALTELDRSAATDSAGRYSLVQVPPGPHHVAVRRLGYRPRYLHALVPRDGELEINVALQAEPVRLHPVDVRTQVSIRGTEGGTTTDFPDREMSTAAVINHPLLGEPDVFKALGGGEVVANPETPGGLYIRGGASDQTAYLLDGIPVFNPYHSAGVSSAWNPDALTRLYLSSIEPRPGSPHALSGTVEGATRNPGNRFYSRGSLSTTQARVTVDGPIGRAGAGYVLSARSGLHDIVAPPDEPDYLGGPTADWLAKLETPALGGRFRMLSYGNANEIDAASVAAVSGASSPRHGFEWHSRSLGAEWRKPSGGVEWRLTGWTAAGDAAADWNAPSGTSEMDATRRDAGFLAVADWRSERSGTSVGVRAEGSKTTYRTESNPDSATVAFWRVDGQTPVWSVLGNHARRIGGGVEIDASLCLSLSEGETYPAPRALLRWRPSEALTISASYAQTRQFAQSLRNPESVVGHIFPVDVFVGSGAPGMPVARSDQGVVAADYRPAAGIRLGIQLYDRGSSGLALVAPQNGGPFATTGFVVGRASARGVAVDAAISSAAFGVLASYGWQRVRNEYGDSSYVPGHAPEHLLEGGLVLFPTSTTSVRVGVSAALGRRATPIPGWLEWESCNLLDQGCEFAGSPDYGAEPLGSTELPPYVRVDVGFRQHWHVGVWGRDVLIALFGTFTNLFDNRNLLTYAGNPQTGEPFGVELRPSGPLVVGIDWSF